MCPSTTKKANFFKIIIYYLSFKPHIYYPQCQNLHILQYLNMKFIVPVFSIALYIGVYFLIGLLKPATVDHIRELHTATTPLLEQLVTTKYFRIIRLNLDKTCPLASSARLCLSRSCRVCRCEDKDIPAAWTELATRNPDLSTWNAERSKDENWVWHVQDEANDEGEYFDLQANVQSFTNYNGSNIWQMIYQQNCFQKQTTFAGLCKEEKMLYRLISGLHTSISTHLSAYYAPPQSPISLTPPTYLFNMSEYKKRVLDHPERVLNLFFLYQVLLQSIRQISIQNYTIHSDNASESIHAQNLLREIHRRVSESNITLKVKDLQFFKSNDKVREFQKYIHNISSILDCVDCQKCRLFGKMQTYGLGTAFKILLGYPHPIKRNELVALLNLYNKISQSIGFYYSHPQPNIQLPHLQPTLHELQLFMFLGGAVIVCVYIFCRIDVDRKVKKQFRHSFPSDQRFKIP